MNTVQKIILTEAQNGNLVSATIDDSIILKLPENPTTGYRWELQTSDNLVKVADDFVSALDGIGAGGERRLHFLVQTIGVARIEAVLRRNWEASIAPQRSFNVLIEVCTKT
ncbi:MAG: protease inhibitor I42 family protein [Methylococcales bacterium]|nr:protease inhibitor I42 family protein [Methylococcales bacterium]